MTDTEDNVEDMKFDSKKGEQQWKMRRMKTAITNLKLKDQKENKMEKKILKRRKLEGIKNWVVK